MADKNFGADFAQLADSAHITQLIVREPKTDTQHILPNISGKQASLKIYFAISRNPDNTIGRQQAQTGLELFGDYVADELEHPDAHPNIRLLLNIIENDETWQVSTD
jgi:hypothetical protein